MLARLFWKFTTPRKLRRQTLALLVAWLAVAAAYQDGWFGDPDPVTPRVPSVVSPYEP